VDVEGLQKIDGQALFVIGAARSGTTVLQNALNDSPHVFLFGEPAFHDDPGSADFAARYNAMHRSWGHQENKSSFCPPLFAEDASRPDYLEQLARPYCYVGSKIVVNPSNAAGTCRRVFDFHCRHFCRAHYVFTFRNPVDVLMSTRGLAELHGDAPASHESLLRSFLAVMALYLRMLRNLPSWRRYSTRTWARRRSPCWAGGWAWTCRPRRATTTAGGSGTTRWMRSRLPCAMPSPPSRTSTGGSGARPVPASSWCSWSRTRGTSNSGISRRWAKRFIQTALREWAYAASYATSRQRREALQDWLHHYNCHRPHSALGGQTPMARLTLDQNNLLKLHI
jgi:transposase InsO family protein